MKISELTGAYRALLRTASYFLHSWALFAQPAACAPGLRSVRAPGCLARRDTSDIITVSLWILSCQIQLRHFIITIMDRDASKERALASSCTRIMDGKILVCLKISGKQLRHRKLETLQKQKYSITAFLKHSSGFFHPIRILREFR